MASVILKRTVFVERDKNGNFRFQDWAAVTTSLGCMVEPFMPNLRVSPNEDIGDFDPSDDMALVTEIREVDSDLLPTLLSGGGPVVHGGVHMPRVGR
jgi:hypothetical protein